MCTVLVPFARDFVLDAIRLVHVGLPHSDVPWLALLVFVSPIVRAWDTGSTGI